MSLENKPKKELVDMIHALKDKLKEMKPVEAQLKAEVSDLHSEAIGLHRDEKGMYHLVHIKYDKEKNAAGIDKLESLDSSDPAIALFNLNKFVAENLVRKSRGGKYDK